MKQFDDVFRNGKFFTSWDVRWDVSDSDTKAFCILENIHTEFMNSMSVTKVSFVSFHKLVSSFLANHLDNDSENILFFSYTETRK